MEESGKLVTSSRWQNIHRLADELEKATAEVKSAYWVQQARKLRSRAAFELELVNGDRAVE